MSIMYWLAVGFAGLLVVGGLALIVYMVLGSKKDDAPSLIVEASAPEEVEEEQSEPESVFSMPGVKTVAMPSEERPLSRREMRTVASSTPTRRRSRAAEQASSAPRAQAPVKNAAPFVAQNAAPNRESSFHELHPDDPDYIPKGATERKPGSFRWEDEED